MRVADFLEREGISGSSLSKALGFKGAEAVNSRKRKDEDIPEAWYEKLYELGYRDFDGAGTYVPPPTDDAEELFRDQAPPQPPEDARFAPPPTARLDYSSIAGHIEGAYKLGATYVIVNADPILAMSVHDHAEAAGKAWANYIQSEPRVAALVEKLMIGTPAGEVIGVHVAIFFAYFLARTAARQQAAAAAGAEAAAEPGSTEAATEDLVA